MGHSGHLVRRLALAGIVRALVWVVVVPDVPVVEFGPNAGPPNHVCPTYTPVDATTGKPLGAWQHC